jgi:chorismate mutase
MSLEPVRAEITRVDEEIIRLIGERQRLAVRIAEIKRHEGLPVRDDERARTVIARAEKQAEEDGIDPEPVKHIFKILIAMSEESQHAHNGSRT